MLCYCRRRLLKGLISKVVVPALLLFSGLLVGLVISEGALRLLAPLLVPSVRALINGEAYQAGLSSLRVSKGNTSILRAKDFQHRQDVLVVGDSMVFGQLVREEDAFPAQIASHTGRSVLNLGVQNSGPCTYNTMLQMALARLPSPPSTVFYNVFSNDINDATCDVGEQMFAWDTDPVDWHHRTRRWREQIFLHSVTYAIAKRMLTCGKLRCVPGKYVPFYYRDSRGEFLFASVEFWRPMMDLNVPRVRSSYEQTIKYIQAARDATEKAGSRFVLTLMPCKEQVYLPELVARGLVARENYPAFYDETYDAVLREARASGITAIDLRPALREEARRGARLYWTLDGHQTPAGHRVTAKVLEDYLAAEHSGQGQMPRSSAYE